MISGDQLFGVAACITAFGAVLGPIVTAITAKANANKIDAVHSEVKMSNGHTLGQVADTAQTILDKAKDVQP